MSTISVKNNVLYYFLIHNLQQMIKIFELINTNDRDTYVEAQEILGNYTTSSNRTHSFFERIKIESRNNAFHVFITRDELIFISYSNSKLFSSEQNFALFDEVYYYLINNVSERSIKGQSFLIEDEKEEIKDIINKYTEEVLSNRNMDLLSASAQTENEKEILQVNSNDDINNNNMSDENYENINLNKNNNKAITVKKMIKNFSHTSPNEITEKVLEDKCLKKNESSGENILNNKKINNNNSLPYMKSIKSNNTTMKSDYKNIKNKISSRTLVSNNSKKNNYNDIKEKPNNNIKKKNSLGINKNYSYNKYNYNNINFKKNKPDSCSKPIIIGILISVIVLQIAAIPLIINLYDFSI